MKPRTLAILAAPILGLIFLQLVLGLTLPLAGLFTGILIALISLGLFRFFEVEFTRPWWPVALPAAMSLLGIVILFVSTSGSPLYLWFAPLLAALTSGAIVLVQNLDRRRCSLCNRRIGGDVAFTCPRCGMLVCERECWDFERCRCRLCEQNRVPILPTEGRWWDRHFGARSPLGRCQVCAATAQDADLRVCAHCGRPQCRGCWDYTNGQCAHCQWVVADLPAPLQEYVVGPSPETNNRTVGP